MTGEKVHGYTLLGVLGTGTFGEVWEAKAPGGFRAAVKIIYKRGSQAEARLELQALEILKGLKHHHLLDTYACWVEDDRVIIAMELADGTLRNRLMYCQKQGQRGIPPDELLHYLREAAEALDYLHARGMFHRDVKPDNILLFTGSNPPHVKLGDCGLLREQGESFKEMTTAGTPPYIAPEVWKKTTLPQSDQYSLAVTFVELRRGSRPIDADNPNGLAIAHLLDVPNLEGLTEGEKQVIGRALSKEPAARFPTCIDMVDALERALGLTGRFRAPGPILIHRPSEGHPGEHRTTPNRSHDQPQTLENSRPKVSVAASMWPSRGSMTAPELPAGPGNWKDVPGTQPTRFPWLNVGLVALVVLVVAAGVYWFFLSKLSGPPSNNGGKIVKKDQSGKGVTPPKVPETLEDSIGMKFRRIEPGTFLMGSPASEPDRFPSERTPGMEAIKEAFYMGMYEVTQAQFEKVMGMNPSIFTKDLGGGPDHPADRVSFNLAQEFCQKLTALDAEMKAGRRYSLPKEIQWEYACRAGTTTTFNTGQTIRENQANFDASQPHGKSPAGRASDQTRRVGSYPANAFGLYDMHGNVWEWCQDSLDATSEDRDIREMRVLRGGAYNSPGKWCRSAARHGDSPDARSAAYGFRIVCEVAEPGK